MRTLSLLLASSLGLISCGGGDDDAGPDATPEDDSVSAGGIVLVPASSMFGTTPLSAGGNDFTRTILVVTDRAAVCEALPSDCDTPPVLGDRVELVINLISETPSAGSYTIAAFDEDTTPPTARIAELGLRQIGAGALPSVAAASGTVTVTRFDDTAVEGTFAVTLDNAETVDGSFAVAHCPAYEELLRCNQ